MTCGNGRRGRHYFNVCCGNYCCCCIKETSTRTSIVLHGCVILRRSINLKFSHPSSGVHASSKLGGNEAPKRWSVGRRCSPPHQEHSLPTGESLGWGIFCFVVSKWHIFASSEVLNLKFFFIVSSLTIGLWSTLWQILDFQAKQ